MSIRDLFYETWHALSSNKGRSILTILGIVIGIGAVIAMTALIGGVQNMLTSEMGLSTSRSIYVSVSSSEPITMDSLSEAEKALPDCEFLTGSVSTSAPIKAGSKTTTGTTITGAAPEYVKVVGTKFSQGSFFTQADVDNRNRVIVLDKTSVNTLFGDENASVVGKTVKIGADDYSIVGVTESSGMVSMDAGGAYIPYTTVQTRLTGDTALTMTYAYAREGADIDALSAEVTDYFKTRYRITNDENIFVMSMDSVIKELDTMMTAFNLMMVAVASISLFVGGIGIMNMMLTNVTERIREIGLRKSLGARRHDVTMQFLLEAIALCVAGGVFGIIFGLGGAWILSALVGLVYPSLTIVPAVSGTSIAFAVGVCVVIGLVFGYYPARRAAKLDPVESLRYQ